MTWFTYLSMGNSLFLIKYSPDDTLKTAGCGQWAIVPKVHRSVLGEEVPQGLGIDSGLHLSTYIYMVHVCNFIQ